VHHGFSGIGVSAMHVTVKRYGGIMAMKPKTRTFESDELDKPTIEALRTLMKAPAHHEGERHMPDAFTYAFELADDSAETKEISMSGRDVPDSLRKLLP
jgi:hypothetical protein